MLCLEMPTCPLEMDAVTGVHIEPVGDKIVFNCRVGLNNIAPLPSDVEVVDIAVLIVLREHGTGTKDHDVGTVLEGTTKLGSVDGQAEGLVGTGTNIDVWILFDWRLLSCEPVNGVGIFVISNPSLHPSSLSSSNSLLQLSPPTLSSNPLLQPLPSNPSPLLSLSLRHLQVFIK